MNLPLEQQRSVSKPLTRFSIRVLTPSAILVIVLGLIRGIVFGPVRSLDFVLGTAYGITFLIAFLAVNQIQVDDRSTATSADLLAELREVGPHAIATRNRLPALVRAIRLPLPLLGVVPLGYATDLIYTRDMWMHRLDLCRATGREMVQTAQHDGRITALVVRDLARKLTPKLAGQAVVFELTGLVGGGFRLGANTSPLARITIDVLDFHLFASGRLKAEERSAYLSSSGDEHLADLALDNTHVPY